MKKIRLISTLLLIITIILSACSGNQEKTKVVNIKMSELYTNISNEADLQPMYEMDIEYFSDIYMPDEIEDSLIEDYALFEAEDALKVDMIILLKLNAEKEINTFKTILENIKIQKMNANANGYNPEQFEVASNGIVDYNGKFIYLVIANQPQKIIDVINKSFK